MKARVFSEDLIRVVVKSDSIKLVRKIDWLLFFRQLLYYWWLPILRFTYRQV